MAQFEVILEITEQVKIIINSESRETVDHSIESSFPECCAGSEYMQNTLGYKIIKIKEVR